MIIHRSHPTSQYTIIPNATLRDARLSYEARGVLVELLSRPDDWSANADGLADAARAQRGEAGEGRRKVRAAFAALEAAGYLRRVRRRTQRGRMVTDIHVYDTPQADDTAGGTSGRPAGTGKTAGGTEVPHGWPAGSGRAGGSAGGMSARPAKTGKAAGGTEVPLTGAPVGGTSIRSTENEEQSLSPRPGSLHAALSAAVPGVTEGETELALAEVKSRPGVISAAAVLRAEIRDGGAAGLVDQVRRKAARADVVFLPVCGQCDDRWIYDDQGRARHCPNCHPAVRQQAMEGQPT